MNPTAARYSGMAASYAALWSPVIRPMAAPVIEAVPGTAALVLEVGCGTGALFGDLGRAAPTAVIAGVDAAEGMLLRAQPGRVACGDAAALPVAAACADAAVAVFMLHHVSDPAAALAEIARVLKPGGFAGTVTWGAGTEHEAGTIWDGLLDAAGAPTEDEPADSRAAMDDDTKVAAVLAGSGLRVDRVWVARPEKRYSKHDLCTLHTQYGRRNHRWLSLSAPDRQRVLDEFRALLDRRGDLLVWHPEVVYALARLL